MRRQTLPLVLALAVSLVSTPVDAAEQAKPKQEAPNPTVAAAWSIGTPLVLTAGAVAVTSLPAPVFGFAVPLSFGAGHVYDGEPMRGLWVGLGGYAAAGLGGVAGYGVDTAFNGTYSALSGVNGMVWGAGIALVSYGCWAAYDAYQTAARRAQAIDQQP